MNLAREQRCVVPGTGWICVFVAMKMLVAMLFGVSCISALPFSFVALPAARGETTQYQPFYDASAKLQKAFDGVDGQTYVSNWLKMLTDDVIVCFPFVGLIDDNCFHGISRVANESKFGNHSAAYINLQVDSFWISESLDMTQRAGIWRYTQTSAFSRIDGSACSVQWSGTVTFRLSASNTSQISEWLESPDSVRYGSTFTCW